MSQEINGTLLRERLPVITLAANGPVGAAATTVDVVSHIGVTASAANLTFTIPNPTDTRSGRDLIVTNTGANAFTVLGMRIDSNRFGQFIWDATELAWQAPAAPLASGADFFRSAAGTTLPDGTTDISDAITRTGNTGLGFIPSTAPVALLDVSRATRTGTDARNTGDALYVTSSSASVDTTATPEIETIANKVLLAKFQHSNQTQGIGIGFDGIQAIGSKANQDLTIKNRGSGTMREIWQNAGQALKEWRNQGSRLVANCGFRWDWLVANVVAGREYLYDLTGAGTNYDILKQVYRNSGLRTAYRVRQSGLVSSASKLALSENDLNKDKIVLYNFDSTGEQFMGFGMTSGAMTYQTYANWDHNFYHAPDNATANLLMQINADGNVGIGGGLGDQQAKLDVRNNAVIGPMTTEAHRTSTISGASLTVFSPSVASGVVDAGKQTLRLAREQVGSVSWAQTAEFRLGKFEANINAKTSLELWLGNGSSWVSDVKVMELRSNGRVNMPLLPVFSNNTQAIAGGLVAGDLYRSGNSVNIV